MQIILSIILLPFTILRFILLAITLFTVKYFMLISIIPYALLWINDLILQILSFGAIPALKQDSILVNNAMNQQSKDNKQDINLSFKTIGSGAGRIYCNNCNHEENIISFIHGFNEEDCNDAESGYQCQSCGKFHSLTMCDIHDEKFICDCGGRLSNEEELFCPQCKSKDITYKVSYVT